MFYKLNVILCHIFGRLLYRFFITGKENFPENGAFIIASNHIHSFDPAVIAICTNRTLRFMAKKELFIKPWSRWFFSNIGAFPVDRGNTDMKSYRQAMDILKNGQGLLIFSQGTRMKEFENAKAGVAMFALKSGAPIIPVGVQGEYKFRSKITVNIGQPIYMDKYKGQKVKSELVDEVMEIVVKEITKLSSK